MPTLRDQRQLAFNADCVAFCPTPDFQDLLAAGCYNLDGVSGSRRGRLYLYTVRGSEPQLLDIGLHDLPGWNQHLQKR